MNNTNPLTPETLRSGGVAVETLILQSLQLDVSTIAYETTDELWCSAYAIEIQKTDSMLQLEALVLLTSRKLHWLEEWQVQKTTENDARLIAEKWLVPEFQRYDLQARACKDVAATVARTLQPLVDWLVGHADSKTSGIFKNCSSLSLTEPLPIQAEDIVGGMILEADWNSVDVLYETATTYGLLTWGTGA